MRLPQLEQAIRRADEADVAQVRHTVALQDIERVYGRAAGGEHRVYGEAYLEVAGTCQLIIVLDRFKGMLVPAQTKMPDLRVRQYLAKAFGQAETRPQDGNDTDATRQPRPSHGRQRRLDGAGLEVQVLGGLIGKQGAQFAHETVEVGRSGGAVAQSSNFVSNNRMP